MIWARFIMASGSWSVMVTPGTSCHLPFSPEKVSSGATMRSSMAERAVTTLKVEPGS